MSFYYLIIGVLYIVQMFVLGQIQILLPYVNRLEDNIIKMEILPKVIYRFNIINYQNPKGLFLRNGNTSPFLKNGNGNLYGIGGP